MGVSGACQGGPAHRCPVGAWPWPCWGTQSWEGPLPPAPTYWPQGGSPLSLAWAGCPFHLQVPEGLLHGSQVLAASLGRWPSPPVPQMVLGLKRATSGGAERLSAPGPSSLGPGFCSGSSCPDDAVGSRSRSGSCLPSLPLDPAEVIFIAQGPTSGAQPSSPAPAVSHLPACEQTPAACVGPRPPPLHSQTPQHPPTTATRWWVRVCLRTGMWHLPLVSTEFFS